jgi:hypothetical protein
MAVETGIDDYRAAFVPIENSIRKTANYKAASAPAYRGKSGWMLRNLKQRFANVLYEGNPQSR